MTLERITKETYFLASKEGMTVTEYMDKVDKENGVDTSDNLDAFERRLKEMNVALNDTGASVGAFMRTDQVRALFPEFVRRVYSVDIKDEPIRNLLIAGTVNVNSDVVKTVEFDTKDSDLAMARIGEGAELPRITVKTKEGALNLFKYGRAIEATYEVVARMGVSMFRGLVQAVRNATLADRVEAILDALVKDVEVKSLDTLTMEALVKFLGTNSKKVGFFDTIIVNEAGFKAVTDILYPIAGKELDPLMKSVYGVVKVDLGATNTALNIIYRPELNDIVTKASGKTGIIAFKRSQAVYEYKQVNSNVEESARFIEKQTQILTVSENIGYDKFNKDAVLALKIGK